MDDVDVPIDALFGYLSKPGETLQERVGSGDCPFRRPGAIVWHVRLLVPVCALEQSNEIGIALSKSQDVIVTQS